LEHGQNGDQFGLEHNVTAANRLFLLDGRVALIAGASRGLGLAMAEGLAEAGATVVANGRSADTLEAVARDLRERGLKVDTSPFDVAAEATDPLVRQTYPIRRRSRAVRRGPTRARLAPKISRQTERFGGHAPSDQHCHWTFWLTYRLS
jgi:hypothetical protein